LGVIYGLCDPNTDEVCYVGQTTRTAEIRLRDHIWLAQHNDDSYRSRWIRSLNCKIIVIVLEENDDWTPEQLDAAEVKWINVLLESGVRLTNLALGGQGQGFHGHGPETRAKMSRTHKGRIIAWGDKISEAFKRPEVKERLAEASRAAAARRKAAGIKMSDETRAKISDKHRGRVFSDEHRAKLSAAGKARWARIRAE
jgi:hypothetical protein